MWGHASRGTGAAPNPALVPLRLHRPHDLVNLKTDLPGSSLDRKPGTLEFAHDDGPSGQVSAYELGRCVTTHKDLGDTTNFQIHLLRRMVNKSMVDCRVDVDLCQPKTGPQASQAFL